MKNKFFAILLGVFLLKLIKQLLLLLYIYSDSNFGNIEYINENSAEGIFNFFAIIAIVPFFVGLPLLFFIITKIIDKLSAIIICVISFGIYKFFDFRKILFISIDDIKIYNLILFFIYLILTLIFLMLLYRKRKISNVPN